MSHLLVVHHAPTETTRRLLEAVMAGARNEAIDNVETSAMAALDPDVDAVLATDAIVMVTPANFGYMSGALKHFFDSIFLAVGGALSADGSSDEAHNSGRKLPYGLLVHGRYDTTGAIRSIEPITGALGWRQAATTVDVLGDADSTALAAATELGATLAALIS